MKTLWKLLFLFAALFEVQLAAFAQSTSNWAWAISDSLSSTPVGLVTDAAGNVYTVGAWLTKYNSSGTLLWQVKLSYSPQYLETKGLAVDAAGNLYIAGNFPATITLDTISLTSSGRRDIFVAKFNAAGRVQWARKAGGPGNIMPDPGYIDDSAWGIAVDSVGNSYITGSYHTLGTAVNFDSITIPPNSGRVFMAKYNPAGKIRWVAPLPAPEAQKIGVNSQGILILRGLALTCYNATNGSVVWSKTKTGNGTATAWGYCTDAAGNSYLTGNFTGTINFSPFSLTSTPGGGASDKDIFLVKYDRNGNVKWARKSTGLSRSNGEAVAADNLGNVYVTGSFRDTINLNPVIQITNPGSLADIFVAKYDSSGTALWAEAVESGGDGSGFAIGALTSGDVYVAGTYRNGAVFGPHALFSASGNSEFFLAKYSANPLGIPENKTTLNFQLYPNPATFEVTISNPDFRNASVKIYNVAGQIVYENQTPEQGNLTVSTQNWPAGIYAVTLVNEGKTRTQKLIITH